MVRFKHRYFLIEVIPDVAFENSASSPINENLLYQVIHEMLATLHGDYGVAVNLRGLRTKYWNAETGVMILRSARGPHRLVASSLPFIKKIGPIGASLRVLHLAGTIRSCNKFLLKHHREQLTVEYKKTKNEKEKQIIRESFDKCKLVTTWTV